MRTEQISHPAQTDVCDGACICIVPRRCRKRGVTDGDMLRGRSDVEGERGI
jgi:hypothetical protein